MTATFPKYLNRLVDFCCDHSGNGCGHHIDAHGYGNECTVPGCGCRTWRDHTVCDHRATDPLAEVERLAREKDHLLTLSAEVLVTLEEAGAELERLRAVADAAVAWRGQFSKPADTKFPRMRALIEAIDNLAEGSTR